MLLKDLQTLATKLATGTLFHVEKAGKAYSVDYSALAKAIIEEYADSTVGGSKQSVQAAITALNSRTNYKVIQTQLALPSSVSIGAGASETVFSNADLRTYTVNALDTLPTSGTLKAASYLWSNAAAFTAADTLVQGGKLTMSLRNVTGVSVTISSVRLLLIYEL